jgi:zinc/manganese transport system ATP-binding protein
MPLAGRGVGLRLGPNWTHNMIESVKGALLASVDIALSQLTISYRKQIAVQDLTGEFATGSLTAVVGPNGAGKSSLLAAIAGQLEPVQGEVRVHESVRGRIAWLPQRSAIDRSFPITTFDLVAMGLWAQSGSFKALDSGQRARVQHALEEVRLSGSTQRNIGELSVGQFQRALFARLWLQDAPVILLDEPFSAVDARTTAELLNVVVCWHREGRTVIAVLHDLEQVKRHFEQTLLMSRRMVAWGPSSEALSSAHLLRAQEMSRGWDHDESNNEISSESENTVVAADVRGGRHHIHPTLLSKRAA